MPQAIHGNRAPRTVSLAPIGGEGQGEGASRVFFPSVPQQARNLAAAASRALGAIVQNKPVFVPSDILRAREAICAPCEENLAGRCRKCGCGVRAQFLRKTHLATERCPLDPPKWIEFLSASAVDTRGSA